MPIYCFKDGFYFLKTKKLIFFLHGPKGDVIIDCQHRVKTTGIHMIILECFRFYNARLRLYILPSLLLDGVPVDLNSNCILRQKHLLFLRSGPPLICSPQKYGRQEKCRELE